MSKSFVDRTFAIVDVETTGGSSVSERIIEIAVIRVENGEIVDSFQSLVNPQCRIPPMITSITGISPDDIADAPTFEEIAVRVRELLSGAVFVAHNARFDYGFVKGEFARLNDPFSAKCLCTVRLSRRLDRRFSHHDLSTLIERWNLACTSRHRAYDDAHALWQLVRKFRTEYGNDKVDTAISELLGHSSLPQHMAKDTIPSLPDGPGVYIFYGPSGETLYVGKSKNIRTRVLSHFSNDAATSRGMNMYQQVASIEARKTAGELGALLLESELIKSMYPLYNKVSRHARKLCIAREKELSGGYKGIELELVDAIDPDSAELVLGVFRSRSQAKKKLADISLENGLCDKLLGLEAGPGPCFKAQIGRCDRACSGTESPLLYNARFQAGFAARRIKAWPYPGTVMITEENGYGDGGGDVFFVRDWCLVGTAHYDSEITEAGIERAERRPYFDYDAYKIISSFILNPSNRASITPVRESGTFPAFEYEQVIE